MNRELDRTIKDRNNFEQFKTSQSIRASPSPFSSPMYGCTHKTLKTLNLTTTISATHPLRTSTLTLPTIPSTFCLTHTQNPTTQPIHQTMCEGTNYQHSCGHREERITQPCGGNCGSIDQPAVRKDTRCYACAIKAYRKDVRRRRQKASKHMNNAANRHAVAPDILNYVMWQMAIESAGRLDDRLDREKFRLKKRFGIGPDMLLGV